MNCTHVNNLIAPNIYLKCSIATAPKKRKRKMISFIFKKNKEDFLEPFLY